MFNLFDGSRQREEYGRRPPTTPSCHPLTTPPRSPDTEPPTITHASECKLPEAVNHFEKIPDSPGLLLFESASRCPFFSLSPPFTFFLRRQPVILVWPSFPSSSSVRKTYVSHRTLPEKRQAAPIDGRGMCSGPYSHLARPGPRQ